MSLSKLVGDLLILCGCSGLGFWYGMQQQKRGRHIREMIRILTLAVSEIRYSHSTMPECLEQIRDRAMEPYRRIFAEICTQLQETDCDLGQVCGACLETALAELPLKQEKDVFVRCFSDVGYEDGWMQQKHMERGREELQEILETEEQEMRKRSRLACSLGAMSGILLVIILL